MPTYQYSCTACGEPLEVVQSFTDAALTECPACSGRLRKVFSAVGVVFKGAGFYRNDSRAGATSGDSKDSSTKDSPAQGSSAQGSSAQGSSTQDSSTKDSGNGSSSSDTSSGSTSAEKPAASAANGSSSKSGKKSTASTPAA